MYQIAEQRKELQSLRERVAKYENAGKSQSVPKYSMMNSNRMNNQPPQQERMITRVPTMLPLDRNVEMKTPTNRGLNTAFVPPFPSKKSTPGSGSYRLSMSELIAAKPQATSTPGIPGSMGSGSRRLTVPYGESRRLMNRPQGLELSMFKRSR